MPSNIVGYIAVPCNNRRVDFADSNRCKASRLFGPNRYDHHAVDLPEVPPSKYADVKMKVLLVAVGNEQPVFDRFVTNFGRQLKKRDFPSVTTLSSSGKSGKKVSSLAELYSEIRGLAPPSNEGCFIYLTGHGGPSGMAFPGCSLWKTLGVG